MEEPQVPTRNQHWYAARTIARKEHIAQLNLINQGFETFLPRFRKTFRRATLFEDGLHPLFPGYIFFKAEADAALWRAVGGTRGIIEIVKGSGRAAGLIPPAFMSELISSCVDGIFAIDSNPLKIGSKIEIDQGPFSGLCATVSELKDNERITVFLEVMGGTTVKIPSVYVSAVDA